MYIKPQSHSGPWGLPTRLQPVDVATDTEEAVPIDAIQSVTIVAKKQHSSSIDTPRFRLIFRECTPVGLVSIWKCQHARVVRYQLRVDEPVTDEELQSLQLVRPANSPPLRHLILSADATQSFFFDERSVS